MIDKVLSDIQEKGYSIQENILDRDDLLSLRSGIMKVYHNNSTDGAVLRDAGIGRGADLQKNIRGDKILWLKKETLTLVQRKVWDLLENLKQNFNEKLFFGIRDFEIHMTVYPPNTFYKKHLDQFRENVGASVKTRKISFILYLNPRWYEEYGGELKLYDTQNNLVTTVFPEIGRMILFLSEDFPHEVLETKQERVSITGWFYT